MQKDFSDADYISSANDLIYIASCAVNSKAPDKLRVETMNLEGLRVAAEGHSLSALAGYVLERAGIHDEGLARDMAGAVRKYVRLEDWKRRIFQELEARKIWYMPLKGAILKDYYPASYTRQMTDCDILIDPSRACDVRDMMKGLGFDVKVWGKQTEDIYTMKPSVMFEIHKVLLDSERGEKIYGYYLGIKDKLLRDKGMIYRYHFSNEDFYIYMTAHEYKHYYTYGTGLRSLLDAYVFLKRFDGSLDIKYIESECEKLGISEFEALNRELALKVFEGESLSSKERERLNYMILSGTYGIMKNLVHNDMKRYGKLKYFVYRIFLPMEAVKTRYPLVYKHKILLPVLPVYRLAYKIHTSGFKIFRKFGEELRSLIKL